MSAMTMALLTEGMRKWAPTWQGPSVILMQNLLAFPKGMLSSLLPCICVLVFAIRSLYFHFVCDSYFPRIRKMKARTMIHSCLFLRIVEMEQVTTPLLMMVMRLSQHKALVWVHQLRS